MERGQVDEAGVCWVHFENVDRDFIGRFPNLRCIVCPATGLDHIDLEACKERGIEVLSLQGETEFLQTIPSTAEHTFALLLALVRKIPWAFDDVRKGDWDRDAFQGTELKGRVIAIAGFGRVGQQVSDIALGFGMLPCSGPFIERFLPTSTILSIHLPLTKETYRLFDKEYLQELPRGAYVVNTSRAEIVDTDSMIALLDEGHIAGYATDFPFPAHPKVLVTPHLGGNTKEARAATDAFMQAKLDRWVEEHPIERTSPVPSLKG